MRAMASVDFKGDEPLLVLKGLETGDFLGGNPSRSSKKIKVKDGKSMGKKKLAQQKIRRKLNRES